MARALVRGLAVLAALVVLQFRRATAQVVDGTWVTQEDVKAAEDANAAMTLFCAGGFKGELDREASYDTLKSSVGEDNFLLQGLQSASSGEEAKQRVLENAQARLQSAAGGIVFAIILVVAWSVCCWTAYPCCECCRVFQGRRQTSKPVKGCIVLTGAAFAVGVVVPAAYAFAGLGRAVDGFDNVACTAASIINGTLGGQAEPYFIGMMPLLNIIGDVDRSLESTGSFMTGLRAQIDSTRAISESVHLSAQTLSLLESALGALPPEVASNKHKCQFCEVLAPVVAEAVGVIDGSIGAALDGVRKEVSAQLSPENSRQLQSMLREAAEPLAEMKSAVRGAFGWFTSTDDFLEIRGHLDGEGQPQTAEWPLAYVLALSLVLALSTVFTAAWFLCRETSGTIGCTDDAGNPLPRYSRVTHHAAGCTWCCCGWELAVLAFVLSGIFSVVSVTLSSACLVMADMDEPMLRSIAPALGLELDGPEGAQFVSILEQCLMSTDPTSNPALFDILTVSQDNASAPPVSLREMIVGQVADQITAKFTDLEEKLKSTGDTIAGSPPIVSVIRMLATPIDMLVVADPDAGWESDSNYQALFSQASLRTAFPASIRCPDGVVSDAVPAPLAGQTILGVDNFVSKLAAYGTEATVRADCANGVLCTTTDLAELEACRAGNRYVALKQQLRDLTSFSCDVFLDPSDNVSDCDPLNMVGTFSPAANRTQYASSCLYPDGTMRRKPKTCGLAEFVTYMSNFGERINRTMTRLDTTVVEVGAGIAVGLKGLVQADVIDPVMRIANGMTCGFMGRYYREAIDGVCFQSIVGFTWIGQCYTGVGVMALLIVVLMYGVWRRAVDNVNENKHLLASA